jgi:hypothetical protein
MAYTLPRTMLRQLRPQGLRMTRVWPQSKLRPLLQTKLRPQRHASLAACFRRGPRQLPMWLHQPTTQRLHQPPIFSRLLSWKAENICRRFLNDSHFGYDPNKYEVAWDTEEGNPKRRG